MSFVRTPLESWTWMIHLEKLIEHDYMKIFKSQIHNQMST